MAGIWERASLILRSKLNNWMDGLEKPDEVIEQVIVDASTDYARCKLEAKPVLANEKKAKEDLAEYKKELQKWNNIAEKAVKAGQDDHATRALENVEKYENKVATQEERVKQAVKQADAVRTKLNNMAEQIEELKSRAADVKADMANANSAKATAKMSGKIGSSAFDQFDRLAEKAARERREAEALDEFEDNPAVSADAELERLYGGASTTTVSDRLAALKEKLGKD